MKTEPKKEKTLKQADISALHKANVGGSSDFWVECNICKMQYKNWTGSTPCCGSIAFMVENGKVTSKISLFASINGGDIEPTTLDFGS